MSRRGKEKKMDFVAAKHNSFRQVVSFIYKVFG